MTNKVIEAIRFATKAHEGQMRKCGKLPFISHPLSVMHYVACLPDSTENMVIAAVLHDTIEDCNITESDIQDLFGMNVAKVVMELTNVYVKNAYPRLNRLTRKDLELKRIKGTSKDAKTIKLADRLHNLESRGLDRDHLRKNYLPESLELIDAIGDACPILADRCKATIKELETWVQ